VYEGYFAQHQQELALLKNGYPFIIGGFFVIAENIRAVKERIADAAARAGRIDKITLVAVTKNNPVAAVLAAAVAGITVVGENRVQEAKQKQEELPDNVSLQWHLIGHLQHNKAKQAVRLFDLIHSIDSERILREVNSVSAQVGKIQDILLQVNVAREESKFGMTVEAFPQMVALGSSLPNVRVRGLMCIAPNYKELEQVRPVFRVANALYENMKEQFSVGQISYLSMGMTHDFEIAIEEGANLVRVGTAIFGSRN
jgi:hypothetical protein